MMKLLISLFFYLNNCLYSSFKELRLHNLLHLNKISSNSFLYIDVNGELYLFGYVTNDEYIEILKFAKFLYPRVHDLLKKDSVLHGKVFDHVFANKIKEKYLLYKRFKNVKFFYIDKKLYIFAPNRSLYDKQYLSNIVEYIKDMEIDIDYIYLNVT